VQPAVKFEDLNEIREDVGEKIIGTNTIQGEYESKNSCHSITFTRIYNHVAQQAFNPNLTAVKVTLSHTIHTSRLMFSVSYRIRIIVVML